jgi:uracil-DNA glycosylase family 4
VGGIGSPRTNLMVVGQHPGPKEVSTGVPFSGTSGDMLKRIMRKFGMDPKDCYLTNVVKCKPIGEDKVNIQAIKICGSAWLDYEVDIVGPKLILALGLIAANYLVGKDTEMGKVVMSKYGIPVVTTYHTAYLLRLKGAASGSDAPQISKDIYERVGKEMAEHWKVVGEICGE